jgi:hypothetical protein
MSIGEQRAIASIVATIAPGAGHVTTPSVRVAGRVAAALLLAVAAFQIALALGAPWGAHAYGGRAATPDGVLPIGYRVASVAAAPLLSLAAWVLLARAGVVDRRQVSGVAIRRATWAVAAFMAVNTAGNLASTSAIERWGMGSLTATVAALGWYLARSTRHTR